MGWDRFLSDDHWVWGSIVRFVCLLVIVFLMWFLKEEGHCLIFIWFLFIYLFIYFLGGGVMGTWENFRWHILKTNMIIETKLFKMQYVCITIFFLSIQFREASLYIWSMFTTQKACLQIIRCTFSSDVISHSRQVNPSHKFSHTCVMHEESLQAPVPNINSRMLTTSEMENRM